MVTINVERETKKIFKQRKLKLAAKLNENVSEDKFVNILMNNFLTNKK